MNQTDNEVLLPVTETLLDDFVKSLTEEFSLPDGDDTYDAIATMILHLPQTKAYMPRSYFGNGVLKSMANRAAYGKLKELKARRDAKEEEEKKANLSLVPPTETNEQSV